MTIIPQKFLVKSVDVIPGRLEKLVANEGEYIEFYIKVDALYFLPVVINCINYIPKINCILK